MALKYHPDKNKNDPKASDIFKEIQSASDTLMDPSLRKKYDMDNMIRSSASTSSGSRSQYTRPYESNTRGSYQSSGIPRQRPTPSNYSSSGGFSRSFDPFDMFENDFPFDSFFTNFSKSSFPFAASFRSPFEASRNPWKSRQQSRFEQNTGFGPSNVKSDPTTKSRPYKFKSTYSYTSSDIPKAGNPHVKIPLNRQNQSSTQNPNIDPRMFPEMKTTASSSNSQSRNDDDDDDDDDVVFVNEKVHSESEDSSRPENNFKDKFEDDSEDDSQTYSDQEYEKSQDKRTKYFDAREEEVIDLTAEDSVEPSDNNDIPIDMNNINGYDKDFDDDEDEDKNYSDKSFTDSNSNYSSAKTSANTEKQKDTRFENIPDLSAGTTNQKAFNGTKSNINSSVHPHLPPEDSANGLDSENMRPTKRAKHSNTSSGPSQANQEQVNNSPMKQANVSTTPLTSPGKRSRSKSDIYETYAHMDSQEPQAIPKSPLKKARIDKPDLFEPLDRKLKGTANKKSKFETTDSSKINDDLQDSKKYDMLGNELRKVPPFTQTNGNFQMNDISKTISKEFGISEKIPSPFRSNNTQASSSSSASSSSNPFIQTPVSNFQRGIQNHNGPTMHPNNLNQNYNNNKTVNQNPSLAAAYQAMALTPPRPPAVPTIFTSSPTNISSSSITVAFIDIKSAPSSLIAKLNIKLPVPPQQQQSDGRIMVWTVSEQLARYSSEIVEYVNNWKDYAYKMSEYQQIQAQHLHGTIPGVLIQLDATKTNIDLLKLNLEIERKWMQELNKQIEVLEEYYMFKTWFQ